MDCNLVVLCGRIAAPLEFREFDSGSRLLRCLVTVRTESPRRRTDVVPVTVWDPPEHLDGATLAVGSRVWVTASVQRRFWTADEGRRSRLEIVAHGIQPDESDNENDP